MSDLDLFGNEVIKPDEVKTLRSAEIAHKKLLLLYGSSEGNRCKNCDHFIVKEFSKTYFKCEKFSMSANPNTDWRANWNACGLFVNSLDDKQTKG